MTVAMWKGGGLEVIDLGVNVCAVRFIEAAREHDVHRIGLSEPLTTTMPNMRGVVEANRAASIPAEVVVGGAPVTPEFAAQIGANDLAPDAGAAVDLARDCWPADGRLTAGRHGPSGPVGPHPAVDRMRAARLSTDEQEATS